MHNSFLQFAGARWKRLQGQLGCDRQNANWDTPIFPTLYVPKMKHPTDFMHKTHLKWAACHFYRWNSAFLLGRGDSVALQ